jgi:putative DNA methylase
MPAEQVLTRRNLPHWYVPGAVHFVTYRLADTIPREVLNSWRQEFDRSCEQAAGDGQHRRLAHKRFYKRYDDYLDTHRQVDWLSHPPVAAMIRGNLYHHDGSKYHLIAYCVMPNHVHVLLQPLEVEQGQPVEDDGPGERPDEKGPLARIMHSLKSYTAHEANKLLGRQGRFWQSESFDHWVRDDEELERVVAYVANNPVKAGLKDRAVDWHFGSALDRFVRDGNEGGWLLAPLPSEEIIRAASEARNRPRRQ